MDILVKIGRFQTKQNVLNLKSTLAFIRLKKAFSIELTYRTYGLICSAPIVKSHYLKMIQSKGSPAPIIY